MLVIQIAAVVLLVTYYRSSDLRAGAETLAQFKVRYGLVFSFLAGFAAGGIIPEIAKLCAGVLPKNLASWLGDSGFNGFAYGCIGVIIDLFYRAQTQWFGSSNDLGTLMTKTAVDMIFFAPLIIMPFMLSVFEWHKFGWSSVRKVFTVRALKEKFLPALLPNWAFWIPVLFCVYAMPTNLQFCFSTLAEAAWSIVFVFIARGGGQHEPTEHAPS